MKRTLLLKVDSARPSLEKIRLAARFIKEGHLVAFPTETVYGLGANALDAQAVLSLFKAKERPLDNPPIVHVSDTHQVYELAEEVSPEAIDLMKRFWPGPLTLIFRRSSLVPPATVAGLDTIAVRMPRHKVAFALIRESQCPIAAPSANLAGKPSPTTAKHVLDDLDGRIDAILDAGPTEIGVESTVLDLITDPPQILRPGGTPYEKLKKVLKNVELDPTVVSQKAIPTEKARSPGMKHKHYAPEAEVIVVEGETPTVVSTISKLAELYELQKKKVGILATDENAKDYERGLVKSLGSRNDMRSAAKNLFRLLREFDSEDVDLIIAESVPTEGLGLAIMNRLRKASGYNIIKAENEKT